MRFVYKEHPLKRCAVTVVQLDLLRVFLEFLYVDDHYLRLAHAVLHRVDTSEIFHQFIPAVRSSYNQSSSSKLIACLFHKSDAINDEIEFHGSLPLSIKIRKDSHGIVCECGLTTPLSVPDNTTFDSCS